MDFKNASELLALCAQQQLPVSEIMRRRECELGESTRDEVTHRMTHALEIMRTSAMTPLKTPVKSMGGLIGGEAKKLAQHNAKGRSICGDVLHRAAQYAMAVLEVNASMGRICAAPTAGSCGILPAVLLTMQEARGLSRSEVIDALLTASGFGAVVMKNATVAGAEGGCQAECGVAAAMAAAAAVQLCGGTLPQMLSAFSHALSACMGLVCDPVAGLVQVPCAQRNASQAVSALVSADQALAGQVFPIPADQMVGAMYRVGRQLPPELKETAQGGIAATDRGKEIAREIHKGA